MRSTPRTCLEPPYSVRERWRSVAGSPPLHLNVAALGALGRCQPRSERGRPKRRPLRPSLSTSAKLGEEISDPHGLRKLANAVVHKPSKADWGTDADRVPITADMGDEEINIAVRAIQDEFKTIAANGRRVVSRDVPGCVALSR